MMYKNSFKILFSNSSLIWKVVLYFLVVGVVIGGLTYASALPILKVITDAGVFQLFIDSIRDFFVGLNLVGLFQNCSIAMKDLVNVIIENMSNLWIYILLLIFFIFIFGSVLRGFYSTICGGVLYNSMSNNMKQSFTNSLVTNFWKSLKLELARLTVALPMSILIGVALYYTSTLIHLNKAMLFITPFLVTLVFILLLSLKTTLLSGWMPALFVMKAKTYPALAKGFSVIKRRFWGILGNSIAIILTVITVNLFVGIFTLGVGLIITVPATYLFFVIFEMVAFYSARGIRFYTDQDTIFEPKKSELTDRKKDIKYII